MNDKTPSINKNIHKEYCFPHLLSDNQFFDPLNMHWTKKDIKITFCMKCEIKDMSQKQSV